MFSMDAVYRVGMLLSHSNPHIRRSLRECIRHITARAHDNAPLFNGIVDHSTSLFSKVFQDYCQMMEQQTKPQEQPHADDDDADM